MARRRMISQELISDEHFNSISIEAQNIFIRMLSVSDDCGVVPANIYKLNVLINTPKRILPRLEQILKELTENGLGYLFDYKGEQFFAFKPAAFQDYQSYILKKATKSEYLRIPKEDFEELSKNFQEILRNSLHNNISAVSTVESKEYKVESRKQKAERATAIYREGKLIIPDSLFESLCSEFNRELLISELPKMEKWLKFNKPKKDYNRFIFNWLNRTNNNGNGKAKKIESESALALFRRLKGGQ